MFLAIFFFLVFLVLIVLHELAHVIAALAFGFKISAFGIGLPLGPRWKLGQLGETEIVIHPILLAVYAEIPELGHFHLEGESCLDQVKHHPLWQKLVVVMLGIVIYPIIAWLVLVADLAFFGIPVPISVSVDRLVEHIAIATEAGVVPGDEIKGIDDSIIRSSDDVTRCLTKHAKTPVILFQACGGRSPDGRVGKILRFTYLCVLLFDCLSLLPQFCLLRGQKRKNNAP